MAEINYYKCRRCGKNTRHISVTDRELAAVEGKGAIVQIVAALRDYTGMSRAMREVGLTRMFKCCECGQITDRKFNGDVRQTYLGDDTWYVEK